MKLWAGLGLLLLFFGCVTIDTKATQEFYYDGTSKITYTEAAFPTPDALRDGYYYFDIYKNPFLAPINYVAPEVFEVRNYIACELMKEVGQNCSVVTVNKKLKGESAQFVYDVTGYNSTFVTNSTAYFKVSKFVDDVNIADIYTYEIYAIPSPISYAIDKKSGVKADLEEMTEVQTIAALNENYPYGVCVAGGKLLANCWVSGLDEQVRITVEPKMDNPFEYHTILGAQCFVSDPDFEPASVEEFIASGAEPLELQFKRGDEPGEIGVTCPLGETEEYYILLAYQKTGATEEQDELTFQKMYISSVDNYFNKFTQDYSDFYKNLVYPLADFKKGQMFGTSALDLKELGKDADFLKRTDLDVAYTMKFEGVILSAKVGNTTITDRFDKPVGTLDQSGGAITAKDSFELDYKKFIQYLPEKAPMVVVVKEDRSPFGLGAGTYLLAALFLALIVLIIVKNMWRFMQPPEY